MSEHSIAKRRRSVSRQESKNTQAERSSATTDHRQFVASAIHHRCRATPPATTAATVPNDSDDRAASALSLSNSRSAQQSSSTSKTTPLSSTPLPPATMVNAFYAVAVALVATSSVASAASMRSEAASMPTGSWPSSKGNVYYSEPYTVKKGETFDGGMKTYQRKDIKCGGQTESSSKTAVFLVEPGATLKNVVIGKDQMEGVHCDQSGCTIQNVWWDDVCEDALSIKGGSASSVSNVIGGGARSADDKVVQHNGLGTVSIEGFYAQDFGKLYRSCGTCGDKSRKVTVKNVYAVNGKKSIVVVNKNWGDQATLENIKIKGKKVDVCAWSQGSTSGEPKELGAGPSGSLCKYSTSTITYV